MTQVKLGVKIVSGATWDECQLLVENELERRGIAAATIPVRGADGRYYAQVR